MTALSAQFDYYALEIVVWY